MNAPDDRDARLLAAAGRLSRDGDLVTHLALCAGQPVPRRRLRAEALRALDEPSEGEPVVLDDALALRLEVAWPTDEITWRVVLNEPPTDPAPDDGQAPRARAQPVVDPTTKSGVGGDEPVHGGDSLSMARERLYREIAGSFPEILAEVIAALSVAATVLLKDQQNPVALNFEGPPSSQKTTVVDLLSGSKDKVYRSDSFTAKSFVSHAASISRERLNEIDLLPRIRHKVVLVPELAPLFGLRQEDLLESFSILTRVLDGSGLTTDSGVHGRRGHTGDYLFAWIGCTTPIEHRVWKTMGKLGSRLLFLEMPNNEHTSKQLVADIAAETAYIDRVAGCARTVSSFLDVLWEETGGARGVVWGRADDPSRVMLRIADYAKLLACLRGIIAVWREGSGDDETYNFSTPITEKPHRAVSLLYALARGHALVHGRRQLRTDDLRLVARAALESIPNDRRAVVRILLAKEGTATTGDVEQALRCSAPTARAILETLDKLGIGTFQNPGPPVPGTLMLADRFRWLLKCRAARALKENRRRVGEAAE
jgi:hypothetical protein